MIAFNYLNKTITTDVRENIIKIILNDLVLIDIDGTTIEPTEEEKWNYIRKIRNEKLSETDWVVIKSNETGTEMPKKYKMYRQALRDLTNVNKPEEVIFPELEDYA